MTADIEYDTLVIQKDYVYHKTIRAATLRYGEIKELKHGFLYEWFIGIGLRYRVATVTGITNNEHDNDMPEDFFGTLIWMNGVGFLPDLVWGVKVGFDCWSKL